MPRFLKLHFLFSAIILGWNPAGFAFGQDKASGERSRAMDSVENLLQSNIADTTRIKTLNALGWELKYQNPDTAILLSTEALELAEKNGDKKGISNSNGNLGAYNYLKGDYPKALDFYRAAL